MTRSKRDRRGKRIAGEILCPDRRDPVGSPGGKKWAKRQAGRDRRRAVTSLGELHVEMLAFGSATLELKDPNDV